MKKYKWQIENETVLDTETNVSFLINKPSIEVIQFNNWLAEGNTPDAADPEPEIITYIPKLAIVDRLITLGKLADALAALNSDATKKARWDAATEIATDDVDVIAVLTACGVDYTQVLY